MEAKTITINSAELTEIVNAKESKKTRLITRSKLAHIIAFNIATENSLNNRLNTLSNPVD